MATAKIVLTPQCICGRDMIFHQNRKESNCPNCGVKWHRDSSGFWAFGLTVTTFTPKEKWLKKWK
ncbi:hypothetical protein [Desulforamulus reducens]|uniref:hypothetical protein n=1 Tax=Desulforamulus reducens TaxID=59610 RepID=UPI00059EB0A5|nr:hypothetical protein [Desulforamulus reducens]